MRAFAEHRAYASGVPVFGVETSGFDFLAHWHPDVELCLVLEGSQTVGVGGRRVELHAGDLAVVASNEIHHYQRSPGPSRLLLVIFRPELAGYPSLWPSLRGLSKAFWTDGEAGEIPGLLRQIVDESRKQDEFRDTVLRGLVMQLCGRLDRDFTVPASVLIPGTSALRLRMAEALSFVRSRFQSDLTLEQAAEHVHLSPWYFSRCFQASCGTGFKVYLNALRVQAAENLLTTTDRTILDIALECGFSGARSFHRAFQRVRGMAPRDARGRPGDVKLAAPPGLAPGSTTRRL